MKKITFLLIVVCMVSSFTLGIFVSAKTTFKDISTKFWANDEIEFLYDKGIINGYPNGNFGPNDTIKRVDAATMIVRALDLDISNPPNPNFRDVTRDSKGFNTIAAVVEAGIFTGIDGKFYPNQTLTRAEMAAIINRAYELEKKNTRVSFKDVQAKHWAYKDIQALVANKITTGFPDNTFKPSSPTTRAEFSAFMTRVIQHIEENKTDDQTEENDGKDNTGSSNGNNNSGGSNSNTNQNNNNSFEVIDIY